MKSEADSAGEMVPLGQIAELEMGQSPPSDTYNEEGVGLPLLNGPTEFGPWSPTPVTWTSSPTKRAGPGDILFCVRGSTGRMNRADQEYCIGRGIAALRGSSESDTDFIYAAIRTHLDYLLMMATGSTFTNLSRKDLRSFAIPWPEPDVRGEVARITRAFDDKIENNRGIAETLEQIAATLFRARFVDFVDRDDLVESEIGPIPKGWAALPVGDLARYVNGKAFTKFGNGRGQMVIRIAELRSGPGASTVYTDHEAEPDFVAQQGDVLFAWSGSLDVYRWHREEALINQHIFKVIPAGYPAWFVFYALKHVMPHFQAIAADKATTMGHIKRSHLTEFAVAVPPADDLAEDDAAFGPLFERALQAHVEAETLVHVRDELLPRLISGQVRVPANGSEGPPA